MDISISYRFRWPRVFALMALSSVTLALCGSVAAQQFSAWSTPANLGSSINTANDEFHPAISGDGLTFFFSADLPGGFGSYDLWVAQRPDRNTDWEPAQNLGRRFNTAGGEAGTYLSADGHSLYFCRDGISVGDDMEIYVAYRNDTNDSFGWDQPTNLGKSVNANGSNCDPTVFVDPDTGVATLYFARLNKLGQSDWDIYQSSLKADGTFSEAVVVPELTSPYRDTHPTVRRDGLEIIFSSTRPGTLGAIDLWVSTRSTTHDKWSTPLNLGAMVNNASFDRAPYLSDDGQSLIFTSDRPNGFGGNDYYISTRKKSN